jgi:hypothetical protein
MPAREFYRTHAKLQALSVQLEEIDAAPAPEHGGSVRVALFLGDRHRGLLVECGRSRIASMRSMALSEHEQ